MISDELDLCCLLIDNIYR